MGGSGVTMGLLRLEGVDHADDEAVAEAVLDFLFDAWWEMLPSGFYPMARDWIGLGEDSLLTIEVQPRGVIFWFYDSVQWPLALAEHWLQMALASRRLELDARLRKLGYGIDFSEYTLRSFYEPETRPFFTLGERIGRLVDDTIEWVDGELEQLGEPEKLAIPAARKARGERRCACPMCLSFAWRIPRAESVQARPGWVVEIVDGYELGDSAKMVIVPDGDEVVLALSYDEVLFAWVRGGQQGGWRRVEPSPARRWTRLALDRRDGAWVARTQAGEVAQSPGWSALVPEGPPADAVVVGGREATLWLRAGAKLWRSTDAGRTFSEHPPPPTQAHCDLVEGDGAIVVALCGSELWVDTGSGWTQGDSPDGEGELTPRVAGDALALFTESGAALTSRDGGQSWQEWGERCGEGGYAVVASGGRWWWATAKGLWSSSALGEPWQLCAEVVCRDLFADPAATDTVWAHASGVALRVTRGA